MHKKLVAILTASALLLGLPLAPANATTPTPGNCTTGSLTIVSNVVTSALGCSGTAVVPASVTSIGSSAFEDRTAVTAVTFESGSALTSIAANAFINTGLTAIEIPSGVTTIAFAAFYGSASLSSITFASPPSLTTVGERAFTLTPITSFELPASVTSVGERAFERTDYLDTFTFASGSTLASISNAMFHYSGLKSIVLPSSITAIGPSAFYSNTRLESITIPSAVTSLGANSFGGTSSLTTVRFEGLAAPSVGADAFASTGVGATAYIKYNATGFDLVSGLWNSLTVSREASPVVYDPVPTPTPTPTPEVEVSKTLSLNSAVLARDQRKVLRDLVREVGPGGEFEIVSSIARKPGMTKVQVRKLALAKAKSIRKYLISRGVARKEIVIEVKILARGSKPKTSVAGIKSPINT